MREQADLRALYWGNFANTQRGQKLLAEKSMAAYMQEGTSYVEMRLQEDHRHSNGNITQTPTRTPAIRETDYHPQKSVEEMLKEDTDAKVTRTPPKGNPSMNDLKIGELTRKFQRRRH